MMENLAASMEGEARGVAGDSASVDDRPDGGRGWPVSCKPLLAYRQAVEVGPARSYARIPPSGTIPAVLLHTQQAMASRVRTSEDSVGIGSCNRCGLRRRRKR